MKRIYLSLSILLLSASVLEAQETTSVIPPAHLDFREASKAPADADTATEAVPLKAKSNPLWEVAIGGGLSQFSTPRHELKSVHTTRNSSQFTGALTVGYHFRPWFEAGLSVTYLKVTFKDDMPYEGSVPKSYNVVYLAESFIPVQLYAKAYLGGETGFRSGLSVMAGYGLVSGDHIENAKGVTLAATPGTGNCFTAGMSASLDYFFNRSFGLGVSGTAQHFWMKSNGAARPGYIWPVTFGARFRF